MSQLPPELRVEIRKIGGQYLAVTERASGQEICTHTFAHDPAKLIHVEPGWMLEKGARAPEQSLRAPRAPDEAADRPPDDELLVTYGQRLHSYLFGDGGDLKNFFQFNDAYRRRARLTLCLHPGAAALWRLPWEYLHDGQDFLCLTGRLLLNRRPEGLGELAPPQAAPPLRILVVIAAPDDQAELNVERELAVITDALDDAQREGLVRLEVLDDASLPALQDALGRQTYHVLHFTGHGVYDAAAKKGHLCFEDDVGQTRRVDAGDLRPLFVGAHDLRLVVLSACQSAQSGDLDAFEGVATGLLQADVPAVLAMQFSILDNSAIEMARVFYTGLARGRTPAQALSAARQAMRALDRGRPPDQRRFDWGVPALYLRAQGMRLIDPNVDFRSLGRLRKSEEVRDTGGLPSRASLSDAAPPCANCAAPCASAPPLSTCAASAASARVPWPPSSSTAPAPTWTPPSSSAATNSPCPPRPWASWRAFGARRGVRATPRPPPCSWTRARTPPTAPARRCR